MARRYAIWDKVSPIITPNGKVFSAEDWKEMHPVAGINNMKIVCSTGDINGGFFGVLSSMVQQFSEMGADFSHAYSDEEKLRVIEDFEDDINASNQVPPEETTALSLASIAASLEFQNLLALEDVEE